MPAPHHSFFLGRCPSWKKFSSKNINEWKSHAHTWPMYMITVGWDSAAVHESSESRHCTARRSRRSRLVSYFVPFFCLLSVCLSVCLSLVICCYNNNNNARLMALCPVSWYQKTKANLDLLEQETVSGNGINWAICKSAPHPRQITTPACDLLLHTQHTTVLRLCGICPGKPGWVGTRGNIHPLLSS